jgi:hypothetical protein
VKDYILDFYRADSSISLRGVVIADRAELGWVMRSDRKGCLVRSSGSLGLKGRA